MKPRKVIKKKEDNDEIYSHMLEIYTAVPPSPLELKKRRRSATKKNKKVSVKK